MSEWRLYMDESGRFESPRKKEDVFILAMLVPEAEHLSLGKAYRDLKGGLGLRDTAVHACEDSRQEWYRQFSTDAIRLFCRSGAQLFLMRYRDDIHQEQGKAAESFAANRYLTMAQDLLEYILFMHEPFLGLPLSVSLYPNSRVFRVPTKENRQLKLLEGMGFEIFTPRWKEGRPGDGANAAGSRDNPKGAAPGKVEQDAFPDKEPSFKLIHVWSKDALRVFACRLLLEYEQWGDRIGDRNIEGVSLSDPRKVEVVFPEFVDILAYALRRWSGCSLRAELAHRVAADIPYGPEYGQFRVTSKRYLAGDLDAFVRQAVRLAPELHGDLQRGLKALLKRGIGELGPMNLDMVSRLEAEADEALRLSLGNWSHVRDLVDALIKRLEGLLVERPVDQDLVRMLSRLLNHRLSVQNHRGEALSALRTGEAIERLNRDLPALSVDEWRAEVEFRNRMAVSAANLFDFTRGEQALRRAISSLEDAARMYSEGAGRPVFDPLMGKLLGTLGQNLAFRAPFEPELFPAAEEQFLAARGAFSRPSDMLRQDSYLFHLYLDWNRQDLARDRLRSILSDPSVDRFLAHPGPDTARFTQFALQSLLKYAVCHQPDLWPRLVLDYTPDNLSQWYGPAFGEHPFELVSLYLGRMAYSIGNPGLGRRHFDHALRVPVGAVPGSQVTLEAIRTQILAWQALEESGKDERRAGNLMLQAMDIMDSLGRTDGLGSILSLDKGEAVGGWFAPVRGQLMATDWSRGFDRRVCESFLARFTFNYR